MHAKTVWHPTHKNRHLYTCREKNFSFHNLNQSINLSGKSEDVIYDSLVDICSNYIQNKSNDSEESIIYVEELKVTIARSVIT